MAESTDRLSPEELMSAADEAERLAGTFRAVLHIGQLMRRVGSIAQAEREAQARQERARVEAELAEAVLEDLRAQIEAARTAALSTTEGARESAAQVLGKAQAEAQRLLSEAKQQIDGYRANVLIESEAAVGEAKKEAQKVRSDTERLRVELDAIVSETALRRTELGDLQRKTREAQEHARRLFGG